MGTGKQRADRAERAKMRSPGRPPVLHRSERRPFWRAIAAGCSSEEAARAAGVSSAVGVRWFRECGGMPPSHLSPSSPPTSGRYLSLAEREQIASAACPRRGSSRDRAATRTFAIDDIARAAAKRRHPQWGLRVSGDHGAVACRSGRTTPQACQTGD